jgi:hypothetical protein
MLIAIDPGVAGGIAVLYRGSGKVCSTKMPETDGDIKAFLDEHTKGADRNVAIIEKVSGFMGGEGQPGSAMFSFGESYGFIRGILTEKGFRIELIRPQDWQKVLGLGHREHSRCLLKPGYPGYAEEKKAVNNLNAQYKREWKNKLKERAQQLYPDQKVTLSTSDVLLILEAGRRINF